MRLDELGQHLRITALILCGAILFILLSANAQAGAGFGNEVSMQLHYSQVKNSMVDDYNRQIERKIKQLRKKLEKEKGEQGQACLKDIQTQLQRLVNAQTDLIELNRANEKILTDQLIETNKRISTLTFGEKGLGKASWLARLYGAENRGGTIYQEAVVSAQAAARAVSSAFNLDLAGVLKQGGLLSSGYVGNAESIASKALKGFTKAYAKQKAGERINPRAVIGKLLRKSITGGITKAINKKLYKGLTPSGSRTTTSDALQKASSRASSMITNAVVENTLKETGKILAQSRKTLSSASPRQIKNALSSGIKSGFKLKPEQLTNIVGQVVLAVGNSYAEASQKAELKRLDGLKNLVNEAQAEAWRLEHLWHQTTRLMGSMKAAREVTLRLSKLAGRPAIVPKRTVNKADVDLGSAYSSVFKIQRRLLNLLDQCLGPQWRQVQVEELKPKQSYLSGKITADGGGAISGAIVNIEVGEAQYTRRSDSNGDYQIKLPAIVKVPGSLIVMANKKGYNTGSTVVGKGDFQHADITLSKTSKDVIQIDKSLHHLGDSHYGGEINSQFQKPKAEGASLTRTFEIPAGRFKTDMVIAGAGLTMTVKGLEEQNPVLMNGKKIGILATSNQDGSATRLRLSVGSCALKSGKNVLTIKSADSNQNDDLDDFEFANIQLVFKPIKDISPDDKQFTKLSSVRTMDAGFGGIIRKIAVTGRFAIEAKGKGECLSLKDMALVNVYREGKRADSSVTAKLVETGSDSGIFHSVNSMSVKSVGAEPGEKIVIRSGIRGASLLVTGRKIRLEGVWESQDAGNHYQMHVTYAESDNKYVGVLSKQGKVSKDVGFSIGERVWTARPGDNWTFVTATQDWRQGKGGITESRELKVTELDLSRSNDDKLVLEDGRVFIRVEGQASNGVKARQTSQAGHQKQAEANVHTSKASHSAPLHAAPLHSKQSGASMHTSQPKRTVEQPGTISMHGGSRQLHAGIPARGNPPGQTTPTKVVKWTVYKLVVKSHGGRLPTMDVLKFSFQKSAKRAAFRVMRYPVSLARNDQSGKIIWSINSAGDVEENEMAIQKNKIDSLEIMANNKKKGGVEKAVLTGMIGRQLGADARQKK